MNTEKTSNRKEWVKNVAIIFLSVMLVLTFFSNTIMNYSLPEVATAMIEPGSITAKIRGTGNLTSEDPYIIAIGESRKIASVAVKQGDVVEKDQVLFYLEDVESAELEEAQKTLDDMLLNYSSSILKGEISPQSYEKIQSGQVSSNAEYQSQINMAKLKVENASQVVEDLTEQVERLELADTAVIDKNAELDRAKEKLSKLGEIRTAARSAWEIKKSELNAYNSSGSSMDALKSKLNTAMEAERIKETAYVSARGEFYTIINGNLAVTDPKYIKEMEIDAEGNVTKDYFEANATKASYMDKLEERAREVDGTPPTSTTATDALTALQTAYDAYLDAQFARKSIESDISKTKSESDKRWQLQNEVAKLEQEYAAAEANYSSQEQYVKRLENEIKDAGINEEKLLANTRAELLTAEKIKEQAQEELEQLLKDIDSELKFGSQSDAIREQREKVAKLKKNATGTVIKAPMAGTITGVNKIAGESTSPNEELAVMQPEGKGFTMSFSVTPEQAKKVTVGEQAEIQNSWYYNDITATLSAIRPDPESNGSKKLLVFNVAGDVQVGQSISVSIGQRSASYDLVVPNSAVREDNNGKFILIVEAKNSPLGNRYMATRVDVEVLGADDNKTAISAPLYGYEFVITTATQPVEAGKQVRLAEN